MTPEFADFITAIDRGGVLVLLVTAVFGGLRGWYVWRWQVDKIEDAWSTRYGEMERDRDWWRTIALRSLQVGEAAVSKGTPELDITQRLRVIEERLRLPPPGGGA